MTSIPAHGSPTSSPGCPTTPPTVSVNSCPGPGRPAKKPRPASRPPSPHSQPQLVAASATASPHPRADLGAVRLEARADRFDDTLRFMRVAHSDRLSARLLSGVVVSTGEKRVANEDHVSDRDAKGFLELTDPIGLVDPRSGDVDGGGAAQMDRECGNQRRKNRFYRLALCEVGIPFFLFVQGRRRTPSRKRDLAVSVFDRFAPMPVRPEAGLPHRLIESADNCLLFVDVEIL